jgi:hypothetical protein
MATNKEKEASGATAEDQGPAAGQQSLGLQLVPRDGSEQPVLANITTVQPTAGVALLDFGFVDPGGMIAMQRLAQAGKKVPERVNGRLAVRVAVSYEALALLHRQIGGVLQAVAKGAKKAS